MTYFLNSLHPLSLFPLQPLKLSIMLPTKIYSQTRERKKDRKKERMKESRIVILKQRFTIYFKEIIF